MRIALFMATVRIKVSKRAAPNDFGGDSKKHRRDDYSGRIQNLLYIFAFSVIVILLRAVLLVR